MDKDYIFTEYAILDAQIKDLTNKKDALKPDILKAIVAQDGEPVKHTLGRFSLVKRKAWTYPEKVEALKEKYDAEKAKAESTGEATYTETESLTFTGIKL